MERFEEALEHLDARVKIPERGYSTQYDKLCEMCRIIDLIEQELGIPLEVLFKALKEGIYHIQYDSIFVDLTVTLKGNIVFQDSDNNLISLKDYGKTWALTKEELKNAEA